MVQSLANFILMTTLLISSLLLAMPSADPVITDYVQPGLKDATFVAKVITGNQSELKKINKDFGEAYRFKESTIKIKEPFMIRMESNVDDTDVLLVMNGSKRLMSIPGRFSTRKDLSDSPGMRQTIFDFGILTPSLFSSLYDAKFVRIDRATGNPVFDVIFKRRDVDTSRHRIWVDKDKKYIVKREWFGQEDQQKATFFYTEPELVGGVWIPTKATVKNTDDKVAGVTDYSLIKVNTGLADSLFKV